MAIIVFYSIPTDLFIYLFSPFSFDKRSIYTIHFILFLFYSADKRATTALYYCRTRATIFVHHFPNIVFQFLKIFIPLQFQLLTQH